ncbi:peptidase S8/S53 domain-containing protein, partial [Ochromonadaceae sp. CCMP2298]
THVAGIFAGRPLDRWGDYEKFEGMSSQAKIVFFDIGKKDSSEAGGSLIVPSDINTGLFEVMYDLGARVFSNSWGSSSNSYDSDAVSLDTFLWTYKDACVLFSNGNSGETGANSAYSPAISKNVIAVGASMNDHNAWLAYYPQYSDKRYGRDSMGGFSSQGPTRDNRMKPDVLAPGFFITSAKGYYNSTEPFCEETALYGTSMSCPTAAGFASKVRQYFKEGHYPSGDKSTADAFTPSGALLKATLIHSSQPMLYSTATADFGISSVSSYPSNQQGYGRIQMSTVL